jgi:hypothetical protein
VTWTIPLGGVTLVSRNSAMHWRKSGPLCKQARDHARIITRSEMARHGWEPATGPRTLRVILIRGKGQRFVDLTNVGDLAKSLIDGIADAGMIKDDGPSWLVGFSVGQARGLTPALDVTVTDA